MQYFTIATRANRNDVMLFGGAQYRAGAPLYPCWRGVDGCVRVGIDDGGDDSLLATQDQAESMVWTCRADAQDAADAMNERFNDVEFSVMELRSRDTADAEAEAEAEADAVADAMRADRDAADADRRALESGERPECRRHVRP